MPILAPGEKLGKRSTSPRFVGLHGKGKQTAVRLVHAQKDYFGSTCSSEGGPHLSSRQTRRFSWNSHPNWKDANEHPPSRSKKFFSPDYHGTMKETSTCFDRFANSPAFSRVSYPLEVLFRCLKVQNMPLEILNNSRRGRARPNVWMFSRVGMPDIVVHRSTLHSSGNCSEVPPLCTFNRPLGGASRVKSQKLCAFRRV